MGEADSRMWDLFLEVVWVKRFNQRRFVLYHDKNSDLEMRPWRGNAFFSRADRMQTL